MENNRNVRTALDWAPEGKGKRGRPKETWRRTVEKERKQLGFNTWVEATRQAQDRSKWPHSPREDRELKKKKKKKIIGQ